MRIDRVEMYKDNSFIIDYSESEQGYCTYGKAIIEQENIINNLDINFYNGDYMEWIGAVLEQQVIRLELKILRGEQYIWQTKYLAKEQTKQLIDKAKQYSKQVFKWQREQ